MARRPAKRRPTKRRKTLPTVAPKPFDPETAITADPALADQIKRAARLGLAPAPPKAAVASLAAAVKPGKERWPVKTGQDPAASQVGLKPGTNQHIIVDTTVEELVKMARPKGMGKVTSTPKSFQSKRAVPVELTVWRITADVTAVKNEDDGDLHLALQGASGETMIAESARPDANFLGKKNPWLPAIKGVRNAIQGELSTALSGVTLVLGTDGKFVPPESFEGSRLAAVSVGPPIDAAAALAQGLSFKAKIKPRKARLTGVGFFDRVHGQLGVASSNGIELHPILAFEWL